MTNKFVEFSSRTANPNFPEIEDITAEELRSKQKDVRIVDVRRPDEWVGEYGHIPDAALITLDTLPDRLDELPKDQTVVFVCRSGGRSAQAAAFARQNGFDRVYNMRGGMIDWTQKNFETEERHGE